MKIISFYLPQFHRIPENDKFWGEGFTEWTNVKKAVPLFDGHEQPVAPLDNYYYDLLDPKVLEWQAQLANKYGIFGFCIYHYWIEGKKLLEKPLELLLKSKNIPIRYCISWANHSWTDSWGGDNSTLIAQTYGGKKDWEEHFQYLLPFFLDSRYIKVNGKPLFLIFNPEDIKDLNSMLDYWQGCAKKVGLAGIAMAYQNYYFGMKKNRDDSRFDYGVEHQPAYAFADHRSRLIMWIRQYGYKFLSIVQRQTGIKINMDITKLEKMDYSQVWKRILEREPVDEKRIPGAFSGWDNTPRKGNHGLVLTHSSPQLFEKFLTEQIRRTKEVYKKDMLFLAAWNEWAEGSMLEPTKKDKYGYLEAVKNALNKNGEFPDYPLQI